jgi:hypothetical protein
LGYATRWRVIRTGNVAWAADVSFFATDTGMGPSDRSLTVPDPWWEKLRNHAEVVEPALRED